MTTIGEIWFWDLETTGLSAKSGDILLLGAFLPLSSDTPVLVSNSDVPDDETEVVRLRDFILEHPRDDFYSWNGFRFDLPFMTERLKQYDYWPFTHEFQYDLKDMFKSRYPWLDGHLDTALKALGIEQQKTPLDMSINRRCANSVDDTEAWDQLIEHCVADVRGTKEVWKKMESFNY